jgi:hypothetical protein
VAFFPWSPELRLDPHLALVLFVAPAILDAGYDTSPHELKRDWFPLIALALFAVLLTTAAVALAGWAIAGLPVAAAIALGAIVAPPDAAAAGATLGKLRPAAPDPVAAPGREPAQRRRGAADLHHRRRHRLGRDAGPAGLRLHAPAGRARRAAAGLPGRDGSSCGCGRSGPAR